MQPSAQLSCEILVVEDDDNIRKVLSDILGDDGYRVHTVAHGQEALDYLVQTNTLPQLILLDLMMPTMTGWEFRTVQRQNPRLQAIPVAILSAISNRLDPRQIVELDAVAFLGKPIDWARLDRVVTQYCPP
jgi:CheY-like chemotaxis protein